ncbi:MAG: MFS transporter [Myxococcota bacterium]
MISQGVKALRELRILSQELPNLRILILSGVVGTLGAGLLNPIFSLYLESRGLTLERIGMVFTVGSLLPIFLQPMLGSLSDRFSRKKFVIGVSLATSLLLPVCTLFQHPGPLAAILALKLMLERSAAPVSSALVGDFAPSKQRATVFALLDAAINLMFVVALVASSLAVAWFSTEGVFYLAGALFFCSSLLLFGLEETRTFTPSPGTPPSSTQPSSTLPSSTETSSALKTALQGLISPLHQLRGSSTFQKLFVYYFGFTFALDLFPIYLPLYAVKLGAPQAWVGPIIASSWLAYALVQPWGGRLSDQRPSRKPLILIGLLGMVLFEAALGLAGWLPPPLALPAMICAWILLAIPDGLFRPASQALIIDVAPAEKRGEVLGALGSAASLANVSAPLLYGMVAGIWGLQGAFLLSAGAFLVAFAAMWQVQEPRPAHRSEASTTPATSSTDKPSASASAS